MDLLSTYIHAGCLAYSSTLKIEATCSSQTSVAFQRTTRRYIELLNIWADTIQSYREMRDSPKYLSWVMWKWEKKKYYVRPDAQ
jgi:hypothetical protein